MWRVREGKTFLGDYSLVPKERRIGITLGFCVVPKEIHDCTLK